MSKAAIDSIPQHVIVTLNAEEISCLADRLYSRSVSTLSTVGPNDRRDLVTASRALRRLLAAYERDAGHQLVCLMLCGRF